MSCCNTNRAPSAAETQETTLRAPTFRPNVDVIESADAFMIQADVPGATAESIDVQVEGRTLTLRAAVAQRSRSGARQIIREYGVGDFERTFRLGDGVDTSNVGAELRNGVLTLRLPKAQAAQPRKISVQNTSVAS
jgi:HSP20 family molecular chaperone IbpA